MKWDSLLDSDAILRYEDADCRPTRAQVGQQHFQLELEYCKCSTNQVQALISTITIEHAREYSYLIR